MWLKKMNKRKSIMNIRPIQKEYQFLELLLGERK